MARLLLVDDNVDIRGAYSRGLTFAGHSVIDCESGEIALGIISSELAFGSDFDAYLFDLAMPVLSGFQVLEKAREIGAKAPCIFITAHGDGLAKARAHSAGAELIAKPLSVHELNAAVKEFLEKHA